MFKISEQLKKENIAEYLLFMWQTEDLIRANKLDIDLIKKNIIITQSLSDVDAELEEKWFLDLIEMMRYEGVQEIGHLQIVKNVMIKLTDLHNQLLSSSKYPFYSAAYYKALPFIVELRGKNDEVTKNEMETCFDALYGTILLKLQKKSISEDTKKALEQIVNLVSMLANYFEKAQKNELEFDQ